MFNVLILITDIFYWSADKFGLRRGLLPRVITESRNVFDYGSFSFLNDSTLDHPIICRRLRIRHHEMLIIIEIFIKLTP
jgi:hypothetical protein